MPQTEYVDLQAAHERVLAENIAAPRNIPPFPKAAMDGYALRSADTVGAAINRPVILRVVGNSVAGSDFIHLIKSGESVSIATGAKLPRGADAVIMVEHVRARKKEIQIFNKVKTCEHVSPVGEDMSKGQITLKKGTWLASQDIGLLATLGFYRVPVFQKPKVAVIATGNELIEPGKKLHGSLIYESNRHMLSCLIKDCGGEPVDLGICEDEKSAISGRLRKATRFDMAVVCGGTSVGPTDYVPELVNGMGRLVIHGVAMKPGSPTGLGIIKNKPVILVPGFPVSAFVAFYTFGRPVLLKMLHTKGPSSTATVPASITRSAELHKKMRTFLRVKLSRIGDKFMAEPISASGAMLVSTLAGADGMVIIDGKARLKKGERVQVIPFRSLG